jgi:hypothetical protein
MPEVNRYSQMIQPLIVNPVSFEEFARLPIARAEAKGAAIAAAESMRADFNVDDADLGILTDITNKFENSKSSLVDRIVSNGVSSQDIGELVKLKRNKENIQQDYIRQAEENKKLIYDFRQNVDKMYAGEAGWYGQLVKDKRYQEWIDSGATFVTDEKGNKVPRMFQSDYGPKYVNVPEYIKKELLQAAQFGETTQKPTGGGDPYVETDKTTQQSYIVTPASGSSLKATNIKNLDATIKRLEEEIYDENTELGRFVKFADISKEEVLRQAKLMKEEYIRTQDIRTLHSPKTRSLSGGGKDTNTFGFVPTENLGFKTVNLNIDERYKTTVSGTIDRTTKAGAFLTERPVLTSHKFLHLIPLFGSAIAGGKDIYKFIKNYTTLKENPADKQNMIRFQSGPILDMIQKGTLTEDQVKNALSGKDPEDLKVVYKELENYMESLGSINVNPTVYVGEAMETLYGQMTKNAPEKTLHDILKYPRDYYDYKTGKKLDEGEVEKLKKDAQDDKYSGDAGYLPLFSYAIRDSKGKVNKELTGGRTISVKGKIYLTGPSNLAKENDVWQRINSLENQFADKPLGWADKVYYINPKGGPNGTYSELYLKLNDLKVDQQILPTDNPNERPQFMISTDGKNYTFADPAFLAELWSKPQGEALIKKFNISYDKPQW